LKTLLLLLLASSALFLLNAQTAKLSYPPAPKSDQVDNYNGVKVPDPYRSLENADAPSTEKWVDEENNLTHAWLDKLPGRNAIKSQLTNIWNYERFGDFYKAGPHYFFNRNSGLQNQSVVYTMDSLNGTPRVFLDPNTYRADGTAALNGRSVSSTGKYYAYAIAQAGSDWSEWHIREIAAGPGGQSKDLPDVLRWTKDGEPTWLADDSGFYYSRYPEPPAAQVLTVAALNEKIYFHKLGTPQSADKLIYERPDHPSWGLYPSVMEGSKYMMIVIYQGIEGKNTLAYVDVTDPKARVMDLIGKIEFAYSPIAATGSVVYMQTNDNAPRGRVIAIDLQHPDRANWKQIIAERPETLDSVQLVDGKLLLSYMKDAHSVAQLVALDGKPITEIQMPGLGTAGWSAARLHDKEMFYSFSGYTILPGIYRLDLTTGRSTVVRQSKVDFDAAAYETKQVFYASKDGTKIPMFLSYKKGLKLDGQNPVMLWGYGGFNIAETPVFSVAWAAWMQMGGVFASACLRGGSEYGEAWHQAGMRDKKQNVFDDFIAAGEWLIANKYTSTPKLSIYGGSNGGLLIGAVLNQRPDLWGAAMPAVGVMDMLRFEKFGFGTQWVGEYGNPENPDDFKVIRKYSPLQNIRKGTQYPPTLITTSDHDDRVMPGHSLKYAATLQQAQEGPAPILIRIETRAGHGAGKPTSKLIDEWTDRFAFLKWALKMN
jgi:prolyl oligopeptidase